LHEELVSRVLSAVAELLVIINFTTGYAPEDQTGSARGLSLIALKLAPLRIAVITKHCIFAF